MVELRKRKAPTQAPVIEKRSKKTQPPTVSAPRMEAAQQAKLTPTNEIPKVGDVISLNNFDAEIETSDGIKTTLNTLVEESKSGVVIFTYPRASTPGCTKQACMFRDQHDYLSSTGLSIFGLSADSPKANTTFKLKQRLQYPLLCDTSSSLIAALGLKKSPKGTVRGVFAVDKKGTVLLSQAGGPDSTVAAVQQLINAAADDQNMPVTPGEDLKADVKSSK